MRKLFLFLTVSVVALSLQIYGMERVRKTLEPLFKQQPGPQKQEQPSEPQKQEQPRLFIKNTRPDAVVVEYTYGSEDYKDKSLVRVAYPQEVIWIGNADDITSFVLSPHGEWRQYFAMPRIFKDPIDYVSDIKLHLGKGGTQMTISQAPTSAFILPTSLATFAPYIVRMERLDTSSIKPRIPLGICERLDDVFKHAGIAFGNKSKMVPPEQKIIKPEYILGVPPKPTDLKLVTSYNVSLMQARNDLIAGWDEVKAVGPGLKKEIVIELIRHAYDALRDSSIVKEDRPPFPVIALQLFQRSAEIASATAGCPST